jgi:hypothetical protein
MEFNGPTTGNTCCCFVQLQLISDLCIPFAGSSSPSSITRSAFRFQRQMAEPKQYTGILRFLPNGSRSRGINRRSSTLPVHGNFLYTRRSIAEGHRGGSSEFRSITLCLGRAVFLLSRSTPRNWFSSGASSPSLDTAQVSQKLQITERSLALTFFFLEPEMNTNTVKISEPQSTT